MNIKIITFVSLALATTTMAQIYVTTLPAQDVTTSTAKLVLNIDLSDTGLDATSYVDLGFYWGETSGALSSESNFGSNNSDADYFHGGSGENYWDPSAGEWKNSPGATGSWWFNGNDSFIANADSLTLDLTITGLESNTTYFFQAFSFFEVATGLPPSMVLTEFTGSEQEFTTAAIPEPKQIGGFIGLAALIVVVNIQNRTANKKGEVTRV